MMRTNKYYGSPSTLSRSFAFGYERTFQIVEKMEAAAGVVSAMHSKGKRDIWVD